MCVVCVSSFLLRLTCGFSLLLCMVFGSLCVWFRGFLVVGLVWVGRWVVYCVWFDLLLGCVWG